VRCEKKRAYELNFGGLPVTQTIISRLFQSFLELERAIAAARKTVEANNEVDPVMLERINSYEEILTKQRQLASELCGYLATGNWDEVNRHIKLINALSIMIKDDAEESLVSLPPSLTLEEKAMMLS